MECSLSSNEVSFDLDLNDSASLNIPTVPPFPAQPAAAFPTYGSGTRAPLMFRGTISGHQHDDMFFATEQAKFFSEELERDARVTSASHGVPEWVAGHGSVSALNPGTQN